MFERFTRSMELVKASATVLKGDKQLLVFPIISACALIVVALGFILPLFGLASIDGIGQDGGQPYGLYGLGFLFYVAQYFVIFYFNTALVGAVMLRLDGGTPTLGAGLLIANSRFGTILGYAVIAATVGTILRMIQERVGFLGRFVVAIIGAGWAVATFLVVPVIVARDAGAIGSIKESAALLKRTWGENVLGQGGMGLFFGLLQFALIVPAIVLFLAVMPGSPILAAVFGAVLVVAWLFVILLHVTLSGIYSAALYRFAANGEHSMGFGEAALHTAFLPKK